MKCYFLEEGKAFSATSTPKKEIPQELLKKLEEICSKWQVRNLSQKGNSR